MRIPTAALALVLLPALAADPPSYIVDYRDGSALSVAVDDAEWAFRDAAGGPARTFRLSEVDELVLAAVRPDQQLARVLATIEQLGAPRWTDREAASRALDAIRADWRDLFADLARRAPDPEIRMRLSYLVTRAGDAGAERGGFDAVTPRGGPTLYGDVGELALRGRRGTVALVIERARVLRITRGPRAGPRSAAAVPVARTGRIERDEPGAFGPAPTRIDFERDPAGTPLVAGADLARVFVPRGFTLATSIAGAIVSVNDYNVGGPSGGMSCATHVPLWEGRLEIRFCIPGQPGAPAAVHRVGMWVAAVSPGGTSLQAFDVRGRRLAMAESTTSGTEFLAVASVEPIHSVAVVPNVAIDPNYTIDDLVFDAPASLDLVPEPTRYVIDLASGERLVAARVAAVGDTVTASGLGIGVDSLALAPGEWTRVVTPCAAWDAAPRPGACWVVLACGSLARAAPTAGGPTLARAPALVLAPPRLAALWGDATVPHDPPTRFAPDRVAVLDTEPPSYCPWRLGPRTIELAGVPARAVDYATAPCLWWGPTATADEHTGWLLLASGERYALRADGFTVIGWGDALRLHGHGVDLAIPAADVMALVAPR